MATSDKNEGGLFSWIPRKYYPHILGIGSALLVFAAQHYHNKSKKAKNTAEDKETTSQSNEKEETKSNSFLETVKPFILPVVIGVGVYIVSDNMVRPSSSKPVISDNSSAAVSSIANLDAINKVVPERPSNMLPKPSLPKDIIPSVSRLTKKMDVYTNLWN
jgi:L-lactate permease